jgi:hypothetical protein
VLDLGDLVRAAVGDEPQVTVEADLLDHHRAAQELAVVVDGGEHAGPDVPDQVSDLLDSGLLVGHERSLHSFTNLIS